jgi:Cys2His2 zinc finger developmental/cell cycle regulator
MATQSQNRSSSVAAFVLRLPDHQKELHQYIWQLFDNDLHTDVALALDDGKHIKAHKLILSAFSPYFRQVLTCVSTPYQYPVIIVKDMVYEDLRSLIEFIYKGSTTVSKERLPQVLRCAKDLKVLLISLFV